jgi:hypothetical protein
MGMVAVASRSGCVQVMVSKNILCLYLYASVHPNGDPHAMGRSSEQGYSSKQGVTQQ